MKDYLTSFTVFLEILKKKKEKKSSEKKALKIKSSENDQSTGNFQSVFHLFLFVLDPRSEKNPVNQLIKKSDLNGIVVSVSDYGIREPGSILTYSTLLLFFLLFSAL